MRKIIVILIVIFLVPAGLTGCASMSDKQRTKAEGTAVGAGAGALAGGILGALIKGKKGAIAGAAIGAAIGGTAGYLYGSHVAAQKEKYASQEDWLDACVASAEKVNEDTGLYNQRLTEEIKAMDLETKRLAAAYKENKIKKAALLLEKEKIDSKLAEARGKRNRVKFELENQEKVLAEAKTSKHIAYAKKLDTEIENLKKYISELETHTESLASMSARMVV